MRTASTLPALALFALLACAPQAERPIALPWHEDDFAAALAEARERELPLFVESWAPW